MSRDHNTAQHLLNTAERLFAEEGIDAVSIRRISSEAGQRNNSALQYHFGSKQALIEAILDYRQGRLNQRRQHLVAAVEAEGLHDDVATVTELMVLPYVELLLGPVEDTYYLNLISQLYSQQRMDLLFAARYPRTSSLLRCTEWLRAAMQEQSEQERELRLLIMGQSLTHCVAQWAYQRRSGQLFERDQLREMAAVLVDFLAAGLLGQVASRRFAPFLVFADRSEVWQ